MIDWGIGHSIRTVGLFLLGSVLFLACDDALIVNQVQEFPSEVWSEKDTLSFPFHIEDTLRPYDIYLTMRHTQAYPYMNLFLFVGTEFPGQAYRRDTIEFVLAGKDGTWLGEGFGRLRYNGFLVRKALVFPDTGTYRFTFVQAMRTPQLEGIRDLGIQIRESGTGR